MRTVAGAPVHIRLPRGILLAAPVENSERFFEKQNTGKSKDIMRYAQKNIMKTCIFKYEIVLTQNEKRANI